MRRIIALLAACLVSFSLLGQNTEKLVRVGADATVDGFLSTDNRIFPSFGIGVRTRVGRPDQWVNFVGGLRYIYGTRLSGFQIPLMLNVNLLKGKKVSGYLGAGYEFDFIGTYWGCMKVQAGVSAGHFDFRVFYKHYQGDIGAGVTYYF
jgi:hypothetical protein